MTNFTVNVRRDNNDNGTNAIELLLDGVHGKVEYGIYTDNMQDVDPDEDPDRYDEIRENPEGMVLYYAVERIAELESTVAEYHQRGDAMAVELDHLRGQNEQVEALRKKVQRLQAELENRSNEDDMMASDAYHHCADIIEPYVGDQCGPMTLSNSVCDSLRFLLNEWKIQNGDQHANGK